MLATAVERLQPGWHSVLFAIHYYKEKVLAQNKFGWRHSLRQVVQWQKNNSWLSILVSSTVFFNTGFLSQIIQPLIVKQHVAWKGSVICEMKAFLKTHHGHKLRWIQRSLSRCDTCFNNFLICFFLEGTGFLCLMEQIRF